MLEIRSVWGKFVLPSYIFFFETNLMIIFFVHQQSLRPVFKTSFWYIITSLKILSGYFIDENFGVRYLLLPV